MLQNAITKATTTDKFSNDSPQYPSCVALLCLVINLVVDVFCYIAMYKQDWAVYERYVQASDRFL